MASRKVKLEFIANNTKRKTTYKKRKESLLKKVEELSTLCGVEACAIVYGPNDPEPELWPSESGVQNVLGKFISMPQWEQSKKMVNQESFTTKSIMKSKEILQKLVKENKEKEMTMFMAQCFDTGMFQPDKNMTTTDLNILSSMIEQNLEDIAKRMEMLKANDQVTLVQPQIQTSTFQTQTYQPQMQTPTFQPQIQTSTFQTQLQEPTYQPQMQATTAAVHMRLLNANPNMQRQQQFMNSLNGNGYETIMPS